MKSEKPVKHVIRDRLRGMAVAYGVIIIGLIVLGIVTQSTIVFICAGLAILALIGYVAVNERSARKND